MKKVLIVLVFLNMVAGNIFSQVLVPFVKRYDVTQRGGLIMVSNSMLTCNGGPGCASGQNEVPPAGNSKDNDFNSGYIDIDGDATTFSSSNAVMNLAACSKVTFAGLYWGAPCDSANPKHNQRNKIKIKQPGSASYTILTADTCYDFSTNYDAYNCFKDITSIVSAAGNGTYTMADLVSDIGDNNQWAGWSIVVAFKNDLQVEKNITVYDGVGNIDNGSDDVTVNISGFYTPPSGAVNFELGEIAYDGDRSSTGDSLFFKGAASFKSVSDALHPIDDIFNSTISNNAVQILTRNPAYKNTLGYDANIFRPNNATKTYLTNGANSASIKVTTGGEQIFLQVITSAIDTYEPHMQAIKTVSDINGGIVNAGDTLLYTLTLTNSGNDTSISTTLIDTMPFNGDYVPNSVVITSGPNSGTKTDVPGDDQVRYDTSAGYGILSINMGSGATSGTGGQMPQSGANSSTAFTFKLRITDDCTKLLCNPTISNRVSVNYKGFVAGIQRKVFSSPSLVDSLGCPIDGFTNTSVTVPVSCSQPPDTSIGGCLPLKFDSIPGIRTGYSYYTSAWVSVIRANTAGTYYGKRNLTGTSCADTIKYTVYAASATISNAGPNQNLCNVTSATLAGNTPAIGGGKWTFVSGPSTPVITSNTSPSSTVTGLISGTYKFRWTISLKCDSSASIVTIVVYATPSASNAGADQNLCNVTNTTLAGNTPAAGSGAWTLVSGPNSPVITSPSNPTSTVTSMIAGIYIFRWTISNGVCSSSTDDVQITIYSLPTVSNAGPDQNLCNITSTNLAANTAAIGSGNWTMISGPNSPTITSPGSPNTTVTSMAAGVYVFRWTISNAVCTPSTDDVQITIYALPTVADAGPDQNLCNVVSVALAGNSPSAGSGTWTKISGPNNPTITTPSSPTSTVTGMIAGVYTFRWTISNGVCTSSTSDVNITIYALPTVANAGPDQNLCNAPIATLAGNNPVSGTGLWSVVGGPITPSITSPSSPTSTVSGFIPGVYTLRWTISNGICTASTDDIQISIYAPPAISNAGPDQSLCNVTSANLSGNTPATGTGTWMRISGPNNPTISTPGSPNTSVSGMIPGIYVFRWTISNGACAPSTDDVQISIDALPTTSNAGSDQYLCNVNSTTLGGNFPVNGSGNWTIISGPNSPTISNPLNPTSGVTGMVAGTYVFQWTISNGVCASSSSTVQITISSLLTIANAGPDQNVCNVNSVTLAGNTAVFGTGNWTLVSGPNSPVITNPANPTTTVTGMITGVYVFRWTIGNGICTSSSDDIQITNYGLPTTSNAGPDQNLCNVTSTLINGNVPVTGSGTWSYISGPNTPTITSTGSANTNVTGMIPGVYILRWSITTGGVCAVSTDDLQITIYALPTAANAGPDQNLCNVNTTTFAGNTPVIGTGNWTLVSGPNAPTITTPSNPTSTVTGMIAGVYVFTWTISNGVCTSSTDNVQITIYAPVTLSNAGPDQGLCNVTNTTLAGNVPAIGSGNWTILSGPNSPTITTPSSPTSTITGMIAGVYTLRWTISNGVCPISTDDVQISIFAIPTVSIAGPNQSLCNVSSATLAGNSPVTGNGTWTLFSGPNSPTITTPTSPNSTVTGMITGVYIFTWTISNGACAASSSNVQIANYATPTISNAGPDQSLCNVTSTTLAGNAAVAGNGNWTLINGPNVPVITTASNAASTVTGMIPGVYVLRWIISNGVCAPSADDVQITIYALPTVANAGPDQNLCNVNNTTLSGNIPVVGIKIWSLISGPNTPTITAPGAPNTSVTGMIPGVYIFRWTISNGSCAPSSDDVQITIYATPTVANAGIDQELCNVNSTAFSGNNPVAGNGNWTMISGPNTPTITDATNPVSTITGMVTGTYTFQWTISNGVCAASSDIVQIMIDDLPTVAAGGADQNLCDVTSITLAGNAPVTGTGNWTVVSGPNSPTITNPSNPSSTVTGMIAGSYVFEWSISNGVCAPSVSDVNITIFNLPTLVDAGPDQDLCNIDSATMAANVPGVGTGTWVQINGPNNPVIFDVNDPNTVINGMVIGTYQFGWSISNGVCSSYMDTVSINIYDVPSVSFAGPDQDICSVTSATLSGNIPAVGTGQWILASGPNVPVITFPDSNITSVTGMTTGVYTFSWVITSGPCTQETSDVQITIFNIPLFIDAGPDQVLCDSTTATMAANVPAIGTGTWVLLNGPNAPTITNVNDPATTISGMVAGTYYFGWTITNGTCQSPTDTISITIFDLPTGADAGADQNLCNTTFTTMAANTASTGTGNWTLISGPNTPTITDSLSETTSILGMFQGTYTFTWTISNGVCNPSTDTVIINEYDLPTIADAGIDQVLCNADSTVLSANTPATGTGSWVFISGPNVPIITDSTNPLSSVTGLAPGDYLFSWSVTNGICSVSVDTVQITINALPDVADAGIDQSLCNASVTSLSGNVPVSGTGTWSLISGPNSPTIAVPSFASTTISGLIQGIYQFAWSITSGVCTPSVDTMQINVFDLPTTANAGVDQFLCASNSITLSGNTPATGNGIWTLSGGPNVPVITVPTDSNSTVTGMISGTYTFTWTISNGTCSNTADSMIAFIYVFPPVVDAGPDQDLCNTNLITLTGNAPQAGAGFWSLVSGPNVPVFTSPNSPSTSVSNITSGTYLFAWSILNGVCSAYSDTLQVIVNGLPTVADAGIDQALCNVTSTTLTGNNITTGIGLWTLISGPNIPVIVDPDSVSTSVTGMISGNYLFNWSISNGTCSVSNDTVQVSIFSIPLVSDAGPDQALCNVDSVIMAGNIPASGTGTWTLESGPNSPVITAPNNNATTITGMIPGTYVFGWTISSNICSTPEDLVTISIDALPVVADAGPDQILCNDTVTILSGNIPPAGTGTWAFISGPNSPLLNSPNSSTVSIENLVPGIYLFSWTIGNGVCPSSTDTVQITVYNLPPIAKAKAGPDQDICNADSVVMAGNSALAGTGTWTLISGPNIPVFTNDTNETTSITGMIPGIYLFAWTITNGICTPTTDTVKINNYNLPSTAIAGADQDLCNGGTATMAANNPVSGTGIWIFVSGPSVPVIDTLSNPAANVTGMVSGQYTFCWSISNGPCLTSTDTVIINMQDVLSPAYAGTDQFMCNNSSSATATILSASPSVTGTGNWSFLSGPIVPQIFSPASPTTIVSGLIDGDYVFRWTVSNGVCTPFSDDVQIGVRSVSTTTNAGIDQILCNADSTMMFADSATAGTGMWTYINGPNSPTINSINDPATTISGMIPGVYQFGWTLSNSTCMSATDTVQITIQPLPSISDAGVDQNLCNDSTAALSGNIPVTGTGRWSFVSGPSIPNFSATTSPNNTVTGLVSGNYIFRWTISNGMCDSSFDDIQITIYNSPAQPLAGNDTTMCGNMSVLLSGSPPAAGTGAWTVISGPNSPLFSCPTCPSTIASNLISGIYSLQWTVTNGSCNPVSDDVQITIFDNPGISNAGIDQSICIGDTLNLAAIPASFGSGLWSIISASGNPVIAKTDSFNTTVTNLDEGTSIFVWTITNAICSQSDSVSIIVNPSPVVTTNGHLFNICKGEQVSLLASGANSYNWSPSDYLSDTSVYNPVAAPMHSITYVVTGTDLNGCRSTDLSSIEMCDTLIVPNGFSPDGDGVNDDLTIDGIGNYPNNTLHIYNRWGNLIYEKHNYDNTWEGIPNVGGLQIGTGKVPSGSYFLVLELGNGLQSRSGYLIIKY